MIAILPEQLIIRGLAHPFQQKVAPPSSLWGLPHLFAPSDTSEVAPPLSLAGFERQGGDVPTNVPSLTGLWIFLPQNSRDLPFGFAQGRLTARAMNCRPCGLQPAQRAKESSRGCGVSQHARLVARGGVLVSPGLGWQRITSTLPKACAQPLAVERKQKNITRH